MARRASLTLEKPVVSWTFMAPWLITLALFWLYPLGYSLYLSFTRYSTLSNSATWIGLGNYNRLLNDPVFWKALVNTLVFVVGTIPFTTISALFLAVLLNRKIAWREVYRSAYFIPSVTSIVVLALIFRNLYGQNGYLIGLMNMVGIAPKNGLLFDTGTALPAIMAMDVWIAIGYYVVLFLAALQTISPELYEAADLDGASQWKQFLHVTLPGIRPMLLFVIVINTIRSFQVFTEVYVMTKGGPLNSTTTLVYQVYKNAFDSTDNTMGYASAIAYVVFILILIVSLLQFRFLGANKEQ